MPARFNRATPLGTPGRKKASVLGEQMTHEELREAINRIGRDRKAFATRMVAKVEGGTATEDDWEQARHYQRQSRIFEQLKENQLFG